MKTALKLFDDHKTYGLFQDSKGNLLKWEILKCHEFIKALTEHDKEIVDKIDEMVKEISSGNYTSEYTDGFWQGYIDSLTQLKQYIKEQR